MMGSSPPPTSADAPPIDPLESPAPTVPSTPPGMSAQGATLELALGNVRFSMSERDLGGARAHLDLARKIASTDEQKHAVERLTVVLEHLTEFWKGMHKAAEAIQSGTELAVKDTVVIVVESGPDALVIRAAGRNLNYRVKELPGALVMAVAESWFDKSASSKLLIGTFLCFDGKGREDMGRKMLADAAAGGVDVKPFLEELKAGGSGVDVGQTRTGAAATPGVGPAGTARPALQIDQDALRQAQQSVRKTFAADFQAATTPPAKEELAKKLISQAAQAGDTPDVQVVMLQEAQRLAVESGKVDLALETVESLVQLGVASSLPLKAEVLEQLTKTARSANSNRQIAQAALDLVPKAAEARNRADAVRLAEVALTAARGSNNAVLMRQAAAVKQQIEAMPKK